MNLLTVVRVRKMWVLCPDGKNVVATEEVPGNKSLDILWLGGKKMQFKMLYAYLEQWFLTLGNYALQGTFGKVWRHFWCHTCVQKWKYPTMHTAVPEKIIT